MTFKFDYQGSIIEIPDASDKMDEWVVKVAETTTYSKEIVIVKSFNDSFPNIKLLGNNDNEKFEYLSKLVSRSDKLLQWFTLEKLKYSELSQLPSYLTDLVDPKEFKGIQEEITTVNDTISEYTLKRRKATEKYKSELKTLDDEMNSIIDSKIKDNKVIKILTLTSQSLPLCMVNAIESYNAQTSDSDFEEKKKLYGRELLTKFKVKLLELIKEKPDLDLDMLIDDLSLK